MTGLERAGPGHLWALSRCSAAAEAHRARGWPECLLWLEAVFRRRVRERLLTVSSGHRPNQPGSFLRPVKAIEAAASFKLKSALSKCSPHFDWPYLVRARSSNDSCHGGQQAL